MVKTMKWVLSIAVLAIVASSVGVATAAPPIIPIKDRKFDHARHAQSAAASGDAKRSKPECANCHKMDAKGVPNAKGGEHATRCNGCHNFPTTCAGVQANAGTPKNPARLCDTCHLPTGNCKLPPLPPKPAISQFQAQFAHAQHVGFKVAIEQQCAQCHPDNAPAGAPATVAHTLCTPCHAAGGGVSISKLRFEKCDGCHQAPKAKTGLGNDPFRLVNFDEAAHRKHHTVSKQASCTGCHTTMSGPDPNAVPRPQMMSCQQKCHDGAAGHPFSATGTQCTTCHKTTNAGAITLPLMKDQNFSHGKHVGRNVKIDGQCASCHSIKDDGTSKVEPPNQGKNHMPCAASGCHQNEFMNKAPKICSVCHDKANPWEKAVARMQDKKPGQPGEYFQAMNHSTHLQKKGTTNAACTDCHGDKLGGSSKGQIGHEACSECHGKGPPAHPMTNCDTCHKRDQQKRSAVSEWSVAQTFIHTKHAKDPRQAGKTTNCVECHADVAKSTSLAQVTKPKMEACSGCHNGKTSFKATGFECSKCHTPAAKPSTPNAMNGSTLQGTQAELEETSSSNLLADQSR